MLFLSTTDFFPPKDISKKSFRNAIRASNGLDLDQDRRCVGPDLDSNCLQRLSVDEQKSPPAGKEFNEPVHESLGLIAYA